MALAPEAPEIAGLGALTIDFLLLCFAILLFGLIRGTTLLVQAIHFVLQHTIGRIPLAGGIVTDITNPVFAAVERGFTDAALGVQGAIGFYWHGLATIGTWVARETRRSAYLMWRLAHYALPTEWAPVIVREIAHVRGYTRAVERAAANALHRIANLERTFAHRAEAAVLPRIHGLERELGHVISHDIAGLRARAREITNRLDALWQQLRKVDALLGTAALTAAVAVVLTRLDLNWIRCRNWNRLGKTLCGVPYGIIDAILTDGIIALAATDLCDLSAAITVAAEAFEPVLYEFVDVEQALVGCHGNSKPPDRALPALYLPPLQAPAALAA